VEGGKPSATKNAKGVEVTSAGDHHKNEKYYLVWGGKRKGPGDFVIEKANQPFLSASAG